MNAEVVPFVPGGIAWCEPAESGSRRITRNLPIVPEIRVMAADDSGVDHPPFSHKGATVATLRRVNSI